MSDRGDAPDLREAVRRYFFALDAPEPGWDNDGYYEAGLTTDEAERALRVALAASQPPSGDAPDRLAALLQAYNAAEVCWDWNHVNEGLEPGKHRHVAITDLAAPVPPALDVERLARWLFDTFHHDVDFAQHDDAMTQGDWIDLARKARAYAEQDATPEGDPVPPLWGPGGPTVGQVITIHGTNQKVYWTGIRWEPV
jgi:hypothetical protein